MPSMPTASHARAIVAALALFVPVVAHAATALPEPPALLGAPIDFILFALTLLGVALFHHHTMKVAVAGLIVITIFKVLFSPFAEGAGIGGLIAHLGHEWVLLTNLLGLLLGFALLSKHFEASQVPAWLPKLLPDDWKGAFLLLVMIFVLSSFLDNIAAALIGGTIAGVVFRRKVHIGFLAAIVAASNAGGASPASAGPSAARSAVGAGSVVQAASHRASPSSLRPSRRSMSSHACAPPPPGESGPH